AESKFSFCIGKNATEAPSLAEFTDEWQALDIPVADFSKMDSNWNPDAMKDFKGYIMSFNQGAEGPVVGANFSYDSVFFYTVAEGGIDNVAYDNVDFIVNGKVIEVLGANGIELFNLNGQLVKSTNGAAIDATNVNSGVYVVRAAGKASKVVL
ncbi:MAG: T9SS type A sorting domain-containing protein, partial [Muribaculaceae bacterium]|nr:T9SS type A sorting domain-containing protein [Muribaculaceae bacterium]